MALKRKKGHEHSLEQTLGQIGTLEQQINAIESANINRETLAAMEKAGEAMKQIHGKLTVDKVDETMYIIFVILLEGCGHADGYLQGQTPRTECAQRGDCGSYEWHQSWQPGGRARSRGRAGSPPAGRVG